MTGSCAGLAARSRTQPDLLAAYGFAVCRRLPDQAEAAFTDGAAGEPRNLPTPCMAWACWRRGVRAVSPEALTVLHRALELDPAFVEAPAWPGQRPGPPGAVAAAWQDIDWCVKEDPDGVTLYAAACVYALIGGEVPQTARPTGRRSGPGPARRGVRPGLRPRQGGDGRRPGRRPRPAGIRPFAPERLGPPGPL